MIRNLIVGLVLVAAACGGSQRNAALKNRVSDERLAPISLADRSQEAEAHQGVFRAEWQLAFTKGQLEGAELEIQIGKNDLASAKLGLKSANLEKAAAEESSDANKISEATHAALVAENEMEVQSLSIDRAKKYLSYLKKRLVYEEALFRSMEAKLEYSRAESLSAAGIVPPDFKLATYKSQYADRQAQAKSYKASVDAEDKELKAIDTQLAKAKATLAAAKNGSAAPAETKPAELMPALPEVPTVPMTTPTEPTPDSGAATPPPKPTSAPPAPAPPPNPKEAPAPAGSKTSTSPDEGPSTDASIKGEQP